MALPIAVEIFNALVADPAAYGIPAAWMPFIRLVALIIGVTSGKLATSPLKGAPKAEPDSEPHRFISLILIAAIGLSLSACALTAPARTRVVAVDYSIALALSEARDQTDVLRDAGQLSAEQYRAINARFVPLLKAGQAFNRVIQTWPADKPAPPELGPLVEHIGALLTEILTQLPEGTARASLLAKLALVQQSILVLLPVLHGGVS